jgi:histidinol-phosphate aminotransferase
MTISRRDFAQLVAAGVGAAAFGRVRVADAATPARSIVRLSANENPYGPSPVALDAMRTALGVGSRYPDEEVDALTATIAKLHGVADDQVVLGDGSSEILKLAAAAFTSSDHKLVTADPTFEAIEHYARAAGADTVRVPLDANYAHDVAKMAAVPNTGVIYVCNPNNPTASITPKQSLRSFLDAVPPTTIVLVDEAYHHYAESPQYESMVPLVASHSNLIVARTFSKIYAMAGIRAGYAVAQREIANRLRNQKAWDSMNVVALTGARVSLGDQRHVADGKRRNSETKHQTVDALQRLGYTVIPSEANFIMIDTRKHVKPLIAALRDQAVYVGRLFPAMPHHLRVTIGTPQEMQRFLDAFKSLSA